MKIHHLLRSLTPARLPSPSSGDATVSVGEGVPGACLLSPPHGPGGAFPVAGPDDALAVGQHNRPREADPVSPGVCHRPQVSIGTRSPNSALVLAFKINQRVNSQWVNETECLCLLCNLPWWCFMVIINASLLLFQCSINGPKSDRDGTPLHDFKSLLWVAIWAKQH